MLRYVFGEHLAPAIAVALRWRGIDAVTVPEEMQDRLLWCDW